MRIILLTMIVWVVLFLSWDDFGEFNLKLWRKIKR